MSTTTNEYLKQQDMKDEGSEQQSASATVKIKTAQGFEWLFTIRRDESARELFHKMIAMEKIFLEYGVTPVAQNTPKFAPKQPEIATKQCVTHQVPMKQNKNGNWYHSRGQYPNLEYCNGRGFPSDGMPRVNEDINF